MFTWHVAYELANRRLIGKRRDCRKAVTHIRVRPSSLAASQSMSVAAVVVAAGRGSRAGGEIPKQYRALAGKPVIVHALEKLLTAPLVDCVLPVIYPDDRPRFENVVPPLQTPAGKLLPAVSGGGTRKNSVSGVLGA